MANAKSKSAGKTSTEEESAKLDGAIRAWIRENIPVEEIGRKLQEGLKAVKLVYKEEQTDFATRLAYIDWIAEKAGYVPEKKISGGTFSLPAPSQESIEKAFGEERPDEQPE